MFITQYLTEIIFLLVHKTNCDYLVEDIRFINNNKTNIALIPVQFVTASSLRLEKYAQTTKG